MSRMVIVEEEEEPECVTRKPLKKHMNAVTKMAMKLQWKKWKEKAIIEWGKDLECIKYGKIRYKRQISIRNGRLSCF